MTAHISEDGLNREETVAEHTEKTANLCREKGKKCNIPNIMYPKFPTQNYTLLSKL